MATPTKSSERLFIESLPRSVAPRDVVAKGKAIGLTIKLKMVYRVRSETASSAPSAAAKAAPKAAPKAAQKAAPKAAVAPAPAAAVAPAAAATKVSPKAAFILSFPRDAKARDIIAAGAKQGLTVSANYISVVRTGSRKKKGAKKAPAAPKLTAVAAAPAPAATVRAAASSTSEKALVGIILDIGIEGVDALLSSVRKKIEALL